MKAIITLTPSEGKRLIAKAVVKMPEFQDAWKNAYLILAGGGTNAFIAQELLNDKTIEPGRCTVGLSTDGLLCVTNPETRKSFPNVFYKGEKSEKTIKEALSDFHANTVIIKGANAWDNDGYVGIITSGFDGGTVPNFIGPTTSKGLKFICPVGVEKQVSCVRDCSLALGGATHIDISVGADPGMYVLPNADIVTEIESMAMLFDVDARIVCRGGIGGNEGACTFAIDGEEKDVKACIKYLEENVKGEPKVKGNKGNCPTCRYKFCKYCGTEGPAWLK